MIELANEQMLVQLLDPVADRERLGVRYCTGGYIFQVRDHAVGDLLSGPTFPDSFNWYDGQGIPDSFAWSALTEAPGAPAAPGTAATTANVADAPATALVLGIGTCDLAAKRVLSWCDWELATAPERCTFRTRHALDAHDVALVRTVSLCARTVRSHTQLTNHGSTFVPVRWFPHPFYPQPTDDALLAIGAPVRFAEGAGYVQRADGFIARTEWPWQSGHYLPLEHDCVTPPTVLVRHAQMGLVAAQLSYTPAYFPIWGNARTFSFEPFLERTVAPEQSLTWWVDYTF